MTYDVTCIAEPTDNDNPCPVCSGKGKVWNRQLLRAVDCSFCEGSGHVTDKMLADWKWERDRLDYQGQAEYFQQRREFEEDRATWARDRA